MLLTFYFVDRISTG